MESVEKCKKSLRKRIDWLQVMRSIKNEKVEKDFCLFSSRLIRGKSMSLRRCAYYALLKNYSTTTIDGLLEKIYGM